jgi:hypothetical protein
MSGIDWHYYVLYEDDVQAALEKLRQQEFEAGRFYLSEKNPATIEEAIENGEETATRSILDMEMVANEPASGIVVPLDPAEYIRLFGTDKPTRKDFVWGLPIDINRGQGVYAIVYKDNIPSEIYFTGYSYD